jgi:glutathione S-transferase
MEYLVNVAKVTEPLEQHPKVKAWWAKVSSRPTWKKCISS